MSLKEPELKYRVMSLIKSMRSASSRFIVEQPEKAKSNKATKTFISPPYRRPEGLSSPPGAFFGRLRAKIYPWGGQNWSYKG